MLECVGHIVDSELVAGARERWIIAEDEPEIVGYDQALWVDRLEHNADDPEVLSRPSRRCARRTSTSGRGGRWPTARGSAATGNGAWRATR